MCQAPDGFTIHSYFHLMQKPATPASFPYSSCQMYSVNTYHPLPPHLHPHSPQHLPLSRSLHYWASSIEAERECLRLATKSCHAHHTSSAMSPPSSQRKCLSFSTGAWQRLASGTHSSVQGTAAIVGSKTRADLVRKINILMIVSIFAQLEICHNKTRIDVP